MSEDDIKKAWNDFLSQLRERGKNSEHTILNQTLEIDSAEPKLTLHLGSELERNLLESVRVDLIGFLKEKLGSTITFESKIVKASKEERRPYTDQEKYQYLTRKNEYLAVLREKLGLDTDF